MLIRVRKKCIEQSLFDRHINRFMSEKRYENFEIGDEYVVFGIVFWSGIPFYYIYEEDNSDYPVPLCFDFFDVIDPTPSSYWRISVDDASVSGVQTFLVFEEWAKCKDLYESLLDGEVNSIEIFNKYRKKIQTEIAMTR
ncbi:hypothetical protein LL967_07785 [Xanthomonas campestris pv. zinniae]|nr:hypothetical protein [Xanthomonas campestris pv. zinniae]